MNSPLIGRGSGFSPGLGELGGIARQERVSVMREQLLPGEEAASLPGPPAVQSPLAALTRFLGPILTVANPAWSSNPIPGMRKLQKTFVEYSLTQDAVDRPPLMQAINVVEAAVKMRLRLQQMRITEAEMQIKPEEEKVP